MRRNDCRRTTFSNLVNQGLSSIATIRDHVVTGQTFEQIRGLRNVMNLPRAQVQAQRIPQTIDDKMQLRTETASATPPGLRLLPAAFFVRLRHRDGHAQSCYRSSRFPYPHHRQTGSTSAPTRQHHTSVRSVCRPYSSSHTRSGASAIALRFDLSTKSLRQTAGIHSRHPRKHVDLGVGSPAVCSIARLVTLHSSSDKFRSNVNRT